MFRVYKPKNVVRVNAVQIVQEDLEKLAKFFMGRVFVEETEPAKSGIEFPTFDGVRKVYVGQYIVRLHSKNANAIDVVDAEKFEQDYEVARNTTTN